MGMVHLLPAAPPTSCTGYGGNISDAGAFLGAPQGSVLGPILLTAYTKPLSDVIVGSDVNHNMYADDGQLHIAFNPRQPPSRDSATCWVEQCVTEVKT